MARVVQPLGGMVLLVTAAFAQEAVRVELCDGQTLRGTVNAEELDRWEADGVLSLPLARALAPASLPADCVLAVEPVELSARGYTFRNPSSTRHFYAPTALEIGKGQGYISQKELMATTAAYGVTDHLAFTAGTALPLLLSREFVTEVGVPFEVGFKLSASPTERIHVAGGVETLAAVGTESMGLGFVWLSGTLGDEDRNLSLGGGVARAFGDDEVQGTGYPVVLGGMWRVRNRLGLVTESWVVTLPEDQVLLTAPAGGLRFLPDQDARWSIDTALIGMAYTDLEDGTTEWAPFPVPWIDFTWYFGQA